MPRWWRDAVRRRILVSADLIAGTLATTLALLATSGPWVFAILFLPVWVLAAKLLGLYDADHREIRHLTIDELPALLAWAALGTAAYAALVDLASSERFTTGVAAETFLAAFILGAFLRGLGRFLWRRAMPPERTLVIGQGDLATAIGRKIELFPDLHLAVAWTVDPGKDDGPDLTESLRRRLRGVDRAIVAWPDADPGFIERLVSLCREREVKLSVVSPFRGRARPASRLSAVADLPVLEYNTWDVPRSTQALKRIFDVTVAATGLLVLMPLALAIAVAIKLDSRGPVLFRQQRAGKNGKPFMMLKFRSMTSDAEERLGEVVSLKQLDQPAYKLQRDPRVTRVGRVLRRYSLDELPQLVNVLKGEMSLVGPRPEDTQVVALYRPEHRVRLELRPGMTGPMQVHGRADLSFQERLDEELDYIENQSVTRDLRVLAETLPALIRGRGAY
jgi:exopolysaccharide biosynthesis polyprenyl glycosylphosphotransferase